MEFCQRHQPQQPDPYSSAVCRLSFARRHTPLLPPRTGENDVSVSGIDGQRHSISPFWEKHIPGNCVSFAACVHQDQRPVAIEIFETAFYNAASCMRRWYRRSRAPTPATARSGSNPSAPVPVPAVEAGSTRPMPPPAACRLFSAWLVAGAFIVRRCVREIDSDRPRIRRSPPLRSGCPTVSVATKHVIRPFERECRPSASSDTVSSTAGPPQRRPAPRCGGRSGRRRSSHTDYRA